MKNFKKVFAGLTAMTMVASMAAMVASAAYESDAEGKSNPLSIDGKGTVNYIPAANAISVILPTDANFDFTVDVLDASSSGIIDFDGAAPEVVNNSPFAIDFTVKAKVTGDAVVVADVDDVRADDETNVFIYVADEQVSGKGFVLSDSDRTLTYALGAANTVVKDDKTGYDIVPNSGKSLTLGFAGEANPGADWSEFLPTGEGTPESSVPVTIAKGSATAGGLAAVLAAIDAGDNLFKATGETGDGSSIIVTAVSDLYAELELTNLDLVDMDNGDAPVTTVEDAIAVFEAGFLFDDDASDMITDLSDVLALVDPAAAYYAEDDTEVGTKTTAAIPGGAAAKNLGIAVVFEYDKSVAGNAAKVNAVNEAPTASVPSVALITVPTADVDFDLPTPEAEPDAPEGSAVLGNNGRNVTITLENAVDADFEFTGDWEVTGGTLQNDTAFGAQGSPTTVVVEAEVITVSNMASSLANAAGGWKVLNLTNGSDTIVLTRADNSMDAPTVVITADRG